MAVPRTATVWVWIGGLETDGGACLAGSVFAAAKEAGTGAEGRAAGRIAGAAVAGRGAVDGAWGGFAADAEGGMEPGFKRAAISTTVQRRWGSRCKQWRAMSRKTAGRVSGTSGSCTVEPAEAGRCCVRASTRVTPSDQMSPAGEIIPFATSGES